MRPSAAPGQRFEAAALARRFVKVRAQTEALADPLSDEDCQVQSMPDASPVKWHLAHVTWFFETVVLERFEPNFAPHHPAFRVLFNSYYNGIGDQHPRAQRGLVTRPSRSEVQGYRSAVDQRVMALLDAPPARPDDLEALHRMVELGLQHEQQHQELLLTDLLHLFSCNPLLPVYQPRWPLATVAPTPLDWVDFDGGLVETGHDAAVSFGFDNETPRHRTWLEPYALGNRLVTNGEWQAFIADGGYRDARWWLAAGWDWLRADGIQAPMYWRAGSDAPDAWPHCFTLHGVVPVDPHTPVTHISLYEADAFARWSAAQQGLKLRLPTESEWEHAAAPLAAARIAAGNFLESRSLHPVPVASHQAGGHGVMQMFGDVWEWTGSSYLPYPGYQGWEGVVGEYNGKFMANQTVLRGGSCATPRDHIRASYRNFFPADARWQFSGLRLACDP
ncbi:MAG TPA: ergothioneine biosynthesis protein EgtB [Rubrivivax sp.]